MASSTRPDSQTSSAAPAILAAALLFLWPAFYNHYPLVYADSITYLDDGRHILAALLHPHTLQLGYIRSPLYSLGILAVDWQLSPWPVIVLQALLTAWVLWLVVRCTVRRYPLLTYLALALALSICTGLPWSVCWLLPDVLGPLLYLSLFLLVFARESLSRTETTLLSILLIFCADSHLTHLTLAIALCILLAILILLWPRLMRPRAARVLHASLLVAIAVVLQLGLNLALTGRASLAGNAPPFLTARLLADGPARDVLQQRCPTLHWTICQYAAHLPTDSDDFLWDSHGIARSSTPQQLDELRREQMPLLLATLRERPWQQARISLRNFWSQLTTFDIEEFGNNAWAQSMIGSVLPGARDHYNASLQAEDALDTDLFSEIQQWIVIASLAALVIALPLCWRLRQTILIALAAILIFAIVGNAFLTGVLSVVDSRYQMRVIWLLPLLATLLATRLLEDAPEAPASPSRIR